MAALAAVFLSVVGCTLPIPQGGQSGNNKNVAIPSPSPSPSPTPTQQLAASGPAFHVGEVGVGYTPVALTATGGALPYHWSVINGAVPVGLSVGDDGTLSGVPTSPGKYDFTIQVADSGDSKATIAGSITIADRVNASLIPSCAKYCTVELGCVNVCGNFGTQSGGVGPFTYLLAQGQLPSGSSLSGLSLKGTFGGLTGYLQFTVQVTDSLGATDTVSPTFWMYPHISLANGNCSVNYGQTCATQMAISGGVPNDHFTVKLVSDNPPGVNQGCGSPGPAQAGWYGVSGSSVVIAIPGDVQNGSGYGAIWTLQVTDTALCGPSTYCTSNQATAVVEVQCG